MQKFYLTEKWFKKLTLCILFLIGTQLATLATAYSAPKTVLVLGDSLSAEYGLARGTGWVALLIQRIHEKKMDVRVINASISGETTSGGLARVADLLKKYRPTTVIIELGGNDGLRGLSLKASEKNFRSIISASQAAKANVLLVGMQIPPNYGRAYTDQFSAMYGNIAKETKVVLVPFFLKGIVENPDFFQADHIHLTAAAHPHMLENVWPYLLPLIST